MKREFLQGLSVAGEPLSKEVIDAIMAENGRDIEAAKGDPTRLNALLAEKESWAAALQAEKQRHETEVGQMRFSYALDSAIRDARGRNAKAISALLDLDTLRGDPEAIGEALQKVQLEAPYLFESELRPPQYSRLTGSTGVFREEGPATLAGALKERMNYERK